MHFQKGCELLEQFFGRRLDAVSSSRGPKYDLDVVIATLPDPVDSRQDSMHDLLLEAIRRGFEDSGFITDRFWLPTRRDSVSLQPVHGTGRWLPCKNAKSGSAGSASDPLSGCVRRASREVHPGVILFRSKEDPLSFRLLYVVGEVPTGGIHKEALENALHERARLTSMQPLFTVPTPEPGSEPERELKILGPIFSGSARSLHRALENWRSSHQAKDSIRIISGSATDPTNRTILESIERTSFRAMVHPTAVLDSLLWQHVLPSMEVCPHQVVVLRESSTQYGRSTNYDSVASTGSGCAAGRDPYVIPFPMNIGSLQTEYERAPKAVGTQGMPGMVEAPRIPLSLQDSLRPKESPPVHSRMTPPTIDLVLEEITRTLRTHKIRAVVLHATDVRDRLFLGDFVRQRLHDVQLITIGANVLYLSPEYNRSLRGMLVLSSYPLTLESQWWAGIRDSRRLAFATDNSFGVYNAALFLLGREEEAVNYSFPTESGATDSSTAPPPVWLSTLGSNSHSPLRVWRVDCPLADSKETHLSARLSTAGSDPLSPLRVWRLDCPAARKAYPPIWLSTVGSNSLSPLRVWQVGSSEYVQEFKDLSSDSASAPPGNPASARTVSSLVYWTWVLLGLGILYVAFVRLRIPAAVAELRDRFGPDAARHRQHQADLREIREALGKAPDDRRELHRMVEENSLCSDEQGYLVLQQVALIGMFLPAAILMSKVSFSPPVDGFTLALTILVVAMSGFRIMAISAELGARCFENWSPVWTYIRNGGTDGKGRSQDRGSALTTDRGPTSAGEGSQAHAPSAASAAEKDERPRSDHYWVQRNEGWLYLLEMIRWAMFLLFIGLYLGLVGWYAWQIHSLSSDGGIGLDLLFARSWQLDSGVSPLVPLVLTGIFLVVWSTWHLHRIRLLRTEDRAGKGASELTPFEEACRRETAKQKREDPSQEHTTTDRENGNRADKDALEVNQIRRRLHRFFGRKADGHFVVVLVLAGALIFCQFGLPVESLAPGFDTVAGVSSFHWLLRIGVLTSLVTISWAVYRLLMVWRAFERFLREMEHSELKAAFGRLPDEIRGLTRLTVSSPPAREIVRSVEQGYWRNMQQIVQCGDPTFERHRREMVPTSGLVLQKLDFYSEELGPDDGAAPGEGSGCARELFDVRSDAVFQLRRLLRGTWPRKPADKVVGKVTGRMGYPVLNAWIRLAENLLAVSVVDYIEWVLRHLRYLALFLLTSLLLTTVLISSYPFHPQGTVRLLFLFLVAASIASLVMVLNGMSRNGLLSRITHTEAGHIHWDANYVANLLIFGGIPLLAVISAEFPQVREFLFAWVEPLLRTITKT